MTDPYKTLGVDKKASDDEIKKAYRKLARKYHPDTNPGDTAAEERFKEVQGAYAILSDPEKRKQYDSGGGIFGGGSRAAASAAAARRSGGGFGGFGDILSDLFGSAAAAPGAAPRPERGRDLETDVHVSFEQAMEGAPGLGDACRSRRPAPPAAAPAPSPAPRPTVCTPLPGPRRRGRVAGALLDLAALPPVRRHRHRDQGPVPHLPRHRARRARSSATA